MSENSHNDNSDTLQNEFENFVDNNKSLLTQQIKLENSVKEQKVDSKPQSHASVVAAHYNDIEEKGFERRVQSPIIHLRNFNNWVKSVLMQEYVNKLREKNYGLSIRALDICCGKGGDLMKWKTQRVNHITFADIADVSVQQCRARYEEMSGKSYEKLFSAEFIVADCTKDTLRDKYKDPSLKFDIVSCQFGLHYSFESLPQARQMFRNISECLRPGGYFIGTIPNANEIIARSQKSPDGAFGNRIYNIKLLFDPKVNGYPLFGGKYDFQLEDVVNCPEFLVNFKLCRKIALEYGLEFVYKESFADFFKTFKNLDQGLMQRLTCFECYPPNYGKKLVGDEWEYEHAKQFFDQNGSKEIGTMSQCEWEATTIYMAFAFKKQKQSWDSNGKPVYEPSTIE